MLFFAWHVCCENEAEPVCECLCPRQSCICILFSGEFHPNFLHFHLVFHALFLTYPLFFTPFLSLYWWLSKFPAASLLCPCPPSSSSPRPLCLTPFLSLLLFVPFLLLTAVQSALHRSHPSAFAPVWSPSHSEGLLLLIATWQKPPFRRAPLTFYTLVESVCFLLVCASLSVCLFVWAYPAKCLLARVLTKCVSHSVSQ